MCMTLWRCESRATSQEIWCFCEAKIEWETEKKSARARQRKYDLVMNCWCWHIAQRLMEYEIRRVTHERSAKKTIRTVMAERMPCNLNGKLRNIHSHARTFTQSTREYELNASAGDGTSSKNELTLSHRIHTHTATVVNMRDNCKCSVSKIKTPLWIMPRYQFHFNDRANDVCVAVAGGLVWVHAYETPNFQCKRYGIHRPRPLIVKRQQEASRIHHSIAAYSVDSVIKKRRTLTALRNPKT